MCHKKRKTDIKWQYMHQKSSEGEVKLSFRIKKKQLRPLRPFEEKENVLITSSKSKTHRIYSSVK